jgi:hypothetical protein
MHSMKRSTPKASAAMQPTDRELLLEIRDLLKTQQQTLEEHPSHPRHARRYLLYLGVVALMAILFGGFGAYQYYQILQSIIDQFPH